MSDNEAKLTEQELVHLVLTLSRMVTSVSQVMIARTSKSAALVDDDVIEAFERAADEHAKTINAVKAKLGMV